MKLRIGLAFICLACIHGAVAADATFSRATLARLAALPAGHSMLITGFPAGPSLSAPIRFQRVEIYAPGARILVAGAAGMQELPKSNLLFLRGRSEDGATSIALSLNPDGSFHNGSGDSPDGTFVLRHAVTASGATSLTAKSQESATPQGMKLNFTCGNEHENLDARNLNRHPAHPASSSAIASPTTGHALRFATIGVDTDSAFMSNLFNNKTTAAANWLAGMFNTMNLMYERDISVRLYQGTTILRTSAATDPYASGTYAATDVPADGIDLNNFGNYWQTNESTVTRSFAVLLSGLGPCSGGGCSSSGIAWVNSYCQTASSGGSYAVVQVFSQLSIDPNGVLAAGLYNHELGHNFGANHTHCTDATNGSYPVTSNTIDICYNGEANNNCYNGNMMSCPASGTGTTMSYCSFSPGNGCGQNRQGFTPVQINAAAPYGLLADINAAPAGCLNTTDDIFFDDFEQPGLNE